MSLHKIVFQKDNMSKRWVSISYWNTFYSL